MFAREQIEEQEERNLASYAMKSRCSRGRKHAEKEHPYRTCFQRDRDRVIHSNAFRKLEYKTQVFVNHEGDYYRTRLTHTLEVAQISRSAARALCLNEDLTEAIALAHDLGHTPYGHSGEDILKKLMQEYGDEHGFEHNRQGLRIVEKLERRYPEFRGLNLTYEVREGIIKHETSYDKARVNEYEPGKSSTLEAQIVNLADEIAYSSHDLDDGLTSEYLREEELMELNIWRNARERIGKRIPPLDKEQIKYQTVKFLINEQVSDLIMNTYRNIEKKKIGSVEDVRSSGVLVKFSPEMEKKNGRLRRFLLDNLYNHYKVKRMVAKAERFIRELFDTYVKNPGQLPPDVQREIKGIEKKKKDIEKERKEGKDAGLKALEDIRIICDHIAGMTDRSVQDEYKKLFMPYEKV